MSIGRFRGDESHDGKILVIEDDPGVARFLRDALEIEGYQVVIATNGLQGLLSAQQEEPDLTILDVMLPGLDGFEVCHRLRADPRTSQLPILMVSAKGREIDRLNGEKVGADEYLVKPVDLVEMLAKVDDLL